MFYETPLDFRLFYTKTPLYFRFAGRQFMFGVFPSFIYFIVFSYDFGFFQV